MTLTEYILTYTENDKIVVNLFDYYDMVIRPLDDKFKPYSYYNNKLVLCFFKDHQDVNPSMGWINDRHLKGVKICHCFGCGRTANVVRLHQIISSEYFDKELTEKESCLELAEMFKVPLDDFNFLEDEDYEAKYQSNIKRIDKLQNRYSMQEFRNSLLSIREQGVNLDKVNSECVKMIATIKQLYT